MGPGGFQEAKYGDLKESIPAGTYHLILDAVINANCMIQFEIIQRRGATDTVLATFSDSYMPLSGGENTLAQPFEYDASAPEFSFQSGDVFVFRYSALEAPVAESYIPNGDGMLTGGRIPQIILPK